MTPAVINFDLARDTDYDVVLLVQDAAAVPLDLTGAVLDLSLKTGDDAVPLAVDMVDAAGGHVRFRLPGLGLGMYPLECWLQLSTDTPRERIIRGLVTVSDKVDPRADGNPSTHRYIVRMSDAVTVSVDSVDLAWWAYEQTRLLLGVDYASLAVQAAATAQRAETAAHTSSVNAAASATEAMRHKDAAGLSAAGAATSERNAGTSAQASHSAAQAAKTAQEAAEADAQEVRRRMDRFALTAGSVESLPYGAAPFVRVDQGPDPASHVLNFGLVTGPKGDKGDPGTLASNAGDLDLGGYLTATGGTFSGTVNAYGGIDIPLATGAPTPTAAVNRMCAEGMAVVADVFTTRFFLDTATNTATNNAVMTAPVANQVLQVHLQGGMTTTAHVKLFPGVLAYNNYSNFAGVVLPVRLVSRSKITFAVGKVAVSQKDDLPLDAYTLVPSSQSITFGEILDITFSPDRDTAADGYHVRTREIYWSEIAGKWMVKTTQALLALNDNVTIPGSVARIVYQQSAEGMIDTDERGALWLIVTGGTPFVCQKIATVRGVHNYESYGLQGYYLDITNSASYPIAVVVEAATVMTAWDNGHNPTYYGFTAIETNAIQSETVEEFQAQEVSAE